jgi:hypothetical protein
MGRLRAKAGRMVRGTSQVRTAPADIRQLRADLDRLGDELSALRTELEGSREAARESVADLGARVGSISDRLERLGG